MPEPAVATPPPTPVAPVAPVTVLTTPAVVTPAPVVAPVPPVVTPPAPPVEVKFDLKLPENSPLDQARVEQIKSFAKEKSLTPEQAQMIVERESDALSGYKASQDKIVSSEKAKWIDEIKSHPEIGGDHFDESISLASRVVDKFGTPKFKEILNNTGLGNHPELVLLFSKIGKAYGEDKLLVVTQPTATKKTSAEMLYGPDK
jgi:hypothetical protein